jgi:hypothetical protein
VVLWSCVPPRATTTTGWRKLEDRLKVSISISRDSRDLQTTRDSRRSTRVPYYRVQNVARSLLYRLQTPVQVASAAQHSSRGQQAGGGNRAGWCFLAQGSGNAQQGRGWRERLAYLRCTTTLLRTLSLLDSLQSTASVHRRLCPFSKILEQQSSTKIKNDKTETENRASCCLSAVPTLTCSY